MSKADVPVAFVTGFPSFRASQLVRHLLAAGGDDVWVLVSPSDVEAAERFSAGLSAGVAARFRHFVGEPWAIDFGLSGAEYRQLCRGVTRLHHVAQAIGPVFGKDSHEDINVGTTREALELAAAAERLECLVLHSGLAVSGDRQGYVSEQELVQGQRFAGPGPATLARAELMARRRMARLPIVVARTGQVVGPSGAGALDTLEGVYLLIALCLNAPQDLSPLLPDWGDAPLHVVPAHHYVRAVDALSRDTQALGQTLHLTDPSPMTMRTGFSRCLEIRERLAAEDGLVVPPASSALRRDGVLRDSLQSILWRPRTFINLTFRNVRYGTANAERLLVRAGLECPPLESYFEQLVRHVALALGASSSAKAASA